MSFLERIRPAKMAEAEAYAARFAARAPHRPATLPVRDFAAALRTGGGLIAEGKRTSPSRPDLRRAGPVGVLARTYRRGGACALSIVTDAPNFGTSLEDVAELKAAVDLPVLTKDFIIDPAQVRAAWAAGADAVLLIVAMLDRVTLAELLAEARGLGLAVLVETHSATEVDTALAAGADLVGVNNRDLASLTTDLAHGEALLPRVKKGGVLTVTESGLQDRSDVERMARAGADAFLIGHGLLLASDPGRKVAEMAGRVRADARRVKVCGLTGPEDARQAHEAGADLLGLVFAASPRRVDEAAARTIRAAVPDGRLVGVFRDETTDEIVRLAASCDLDLIQLHGDETPEVCRGLQESTGLPVIKALGPDRADIATVAAYGDVAYFLVDRPKGPAGAAVGDDQLRAAAARIREAGREVFLAGGLTADNVKEAVAVADPFGVDVASGIESETGRKDHDAVTRFIREASR